MTQEIVDYGLLSELARSFPSSPMGMYTAITTQKHRNSLVKLR